MAKDIDLPNELSRAIVNKTYEEKQAADMGLQAPGSVLSDLIGREASNFPSDNLERWRLTALACGASVKSYDEFSDEGESIKYYYAHPVEMADDKTGEIRETIRCVLITDTLEAFGFVSEGIALDLARLINVFGNKPFDPPIKLKVDIKKTRKGFRMYTISPVF